MSIKDRKLKLNFDRRTDEISSTPLLNTGRNAIRRKTTFFRRKKKLSSALTANALCSPVLSHLSFIIFCRNCGQTWSKLHVTLCSWARKLRLYNFMFIKQRNRSALQWFFRRKCFKWFYLIKANIWLQWQSIKIIYSAWKCHPRNNFLMTS